MCVINSRFLLSFVGEVIERMMKFLKTVGINVHSGISTPNP